MNENAFGEEVPNEVGKEGSHLPVGRITPVGYPDPVQYELKPKSNRCPLPPDPLLRQLTTILDSVFVSAARKQNGRSGDLIEEIAYRWRKGRLAAEDEYYKDVDPKDFGYDQEEEDEKTKA